MRTNTFTEWSYNIGIILMILGVIAIFFDNDIQDPLYKISAASLALSGLSLRKINGKD